MLRKLIAIILAAAVPATASAGPLKEAAEKAGRELAAAAQPDVKQRGTRFWTGVALVGGGAVLGTIGGIQLGKEEEDEGVLDDGEDADDSDDGEDSDWTGKAMLGGGIAAATIGGILLLTGRQPSGPVPVVSMRPGGVSVKHTVKF
jgi:hypothetical protein